MTQPITPEDVVDLQKELMPEEVIECFNRMIAKTFIPGKGATFNSHAMLIALARHLNIKPSVVVDKGFLSVSEIYEQRGWSVYYEQGSPPGPYAGIFHFIPKSYEQNNSVQSQ